MLPAVLIPEAANAIDDVAILLEDGAGNEPANPSRCERLAKNLLLSMKILLVALPVLSRASSPPPPSGWRLDAGS